MLRLSIPLGIALSASLFFAFTQDLSTPVYEEEAAFVANDEPADSRRIVFLGGTLMSRMDKYGYLETALTVQWPDESVSFRNLGWPADDVHGTARGEFGSQRNTRSWRPPTEEEGVAFRIMLDQVREVSPTEILIAYGNEAAFADTEEAMQRFKQGYRALIEALISADLKLILLTPTPHCAGGQILPDATSNNARLAEASTFIRSLSDEGKHRLVDLFEHFSQEACGDAISSQAFYENGIHLNEAGYRKLAEFVVGEIGGGTGPLQISIDMSGRATAEGATLGDVQVIENGFRFDVKPDRLPAPWDIGQIDAAIGDAPYRLRVDGDIYSDSAHAYKNSPSHEQFEALRELVIEKNRLYREKIRPLNLAYIYLFRQHEMGHLAHEIQDLDELAEGYDQVIARKSKPLTHRFEIKQIEDWKAPRAYPDHEVPQYVPEPDIAEELAAFTLAEGFSINLFASDPMIANPINMNWDTRGRAWVATSSTYPHLKPGDQSNDRIVILEDLDGDGVADTSKVFAEGLLVPHSVMPVEGGAYVTSTTEFLFLADYDGDDVADDRRVVYSGFGNADVHHMIHGLRWAPWGDLYFTQSIYINSFVETPYGNRRLNGSGVWQFRPETEQLEIYSRGMTNPWGLAFDRAGQSFATDGAGGSGPHYAFPGAKHPTAVGAHRVLSGLIPGKPKNTAAEFVSGGHMPSDWVGSLLANDYRANRTVRYILEESGSGYTAEEAETVLHSTHRSFRPVDIKMGPDGAVYIVDWYNPIIDHGEVDFYHPLRDRSHGRIWRLTANDRPLLDPPKIAGESVADVLEHLKSPEQYTRMQANRELARRSTQEVIPALKEWLTAMAPSGPEADYHRLEAAWLQMAMRAPDTALIDQLLASSVPEVRGAAVRLAGNEILNDVDYSMSRLSNAVNNEDAQVRLEAVNALRGLDRSESVELALQALDQPLDNDLAFALELTVRDLRERWIPSMLGGENVFDGNQTHLKYALLEVNDSRAMGSLLELVRSGEITNDEMPRALTMIASLGASQEVDAALDLAMQTPTLLPAIVKGTANKNAVPENVDRIGDLFLHEDETIRNAALALAGAWQVTGLIDQVVELAEKSTSQAEQTAATEALAKMDAVPALRELTSADLNLGLRASAIAALGKIRPVETAPQAIQMLSEMDDAEGVDVVIPAFLESDEGLSAIKDGLEGVSLSEEIAIAAIRTARGSGRYMNDVIEVLSKAGGLNTIPQNMDAEARRGLIAEMNNTGDAQRGRSIYRRDILQCNACHLVDGDGGKLGPDLSTMGTYMTPESILQSLLDPNSDIKQGYETLIVRKNDGSLVSGLLIRETDEATLLRVPGDIEVAIPNNEIESIENTAYSLMPAGLTSALRRDELVDLMKYLTTLGKEQ